MKIGFFSNQIDIRGTGNALYNYAHYNEEILGNESAIFTLYANEHDFNAWKKFEKRFGKITFIELDGIKNVEAVYHIKSGYDDGFRPDVPYFVHAVFDNQPHGDRYATISPWMGARFNLPYVPHIVQVADTKNDLRDALGIPKDAVVYGRYGGADSFDIPFVWEVINQYALDHPETYFIFMNTDQPNIAIHRKDNFIFYDPQIDDVRKREFINTTDAMIHARSRGETFGIAIGEFAISGKPVITYESSREKAHLQELGTFALRYDGPTSLRKQLDLVRGGPLVSWGYGQYTPDNVMKKFKEVFLD